MKWSFKVARLFGIDVHLHVTFLVFLLFIGAANWLVDGSVGAAMTGVLFFIGLFLCVLLHEYVHALMARRYGIGTLDITLLPIGGVARLERMPEKPAQEIAVALAGPAVNLVLAAGLAGWLTVTGTWQPWSELGPAAGNLAERLLAANLLLVGFNLLPAFPMDGGRVLRGLLALRFDHARSTRIAATVGQAMAVLFGVVGLWGNPMLLVIAVFVWLGAAQESSAAEMKHALDGVSVRGAMLTDFRALAPETTLGEAAHHLLDGSQQEFPIVRDSTVAGILTHRQLFAGLRAAGVDTVVARYMERDFASAAPDEPLGRVLARLEPGGCTTVAVFENGRLVGLVTAENVGELYMLRSALGAHASGDTPGRVPPPLIPRRHPAAPGSPHGRALLAT
jgi:Zn-dependent protease